MTATLICAHDTLSGNEFDELVARCATSLRRDGVRPGDAVALMLRNDPEFLVALWGSRAVGAYAVPINWHFGADEVGDILRDAEATVLFLHADLAVRIGSAVPAGTTVVAVGCEQAVVRSAERTTSWGAWLAAEADGVPAAPPRTTMTYTSGTTGRPKGVRRPALEPVQLARVAEVNRLAFGIRAGARVLITTPLYHSAPNVYASQSLVEGERLVIEPRFDAERALALIEQHRITNVYLVPTLMNRLLQLPRHVRLRYDLSSLQHVLHGAAPCPESTKRALIDWFGPIVHEFYGGSEAGPVTSIDSAKWLERPGSVGRALPHARVLVSGPDGRALPAGQTGLVYVQQAAYPPFTYHRRDDLRAACSHPDEPALFTLGDMGYLDEDGYLFLTDRSKDMVISGGVNIYPAEIEAELLALPGVQDAAVFGIPDAEFGEALMAVVQPLPGVTLDEHGLQQALRVRLAGFKVPKHVTFSAALPREETGKIFKRRLREPYWIGTGRQI